MIVCVMLDSEMRSRSCRCRASTALDRNGLPPVVGRVCMAEESSVDVMVDASWDKEAALSSFESCCSDSCCRVTLLSR